MKMILAILFVSFSALGAETERFHCYTRLTYQHVVYSNRCYNDEVLTGVISQNYPTRVICAKVETSCVRKEEKNDERE